MTQEKAPSDLFETLFEDHALDPRGTVTAVLGGELRTMRFRLAEIRAYQTIFKADPWAMVLEFFKGNPPSIKDISEVLTVALAPCFPLHKGDYIVMQPQVDEWIENYFDEHGMDNLQIKTLLIVLLGHPLGKGLLAKLGLAVDKDKGRVVAKTKAKTPKQDDLSKSLDDLDAPKTTPGPTIVAG